MPRFRCRLANGRPERSRGDMMESIVDLRTGWRAVLASFLILNSATAQEEHQSVALGYMPQAAINDYADAGALATAVAQTSGTAVSRFGLPGYDGNYVPTGIVFANGRFHVLDAYSDAVYSFPGPGAAVEIEASRGFAIGRAPDDRTYYAVRCCLSNCRARRADRMRTLISAVISLSQTGCAAIERQM